MHVVVIVATSTPPIPLTTFLATACSSLVPRHDPPLLLKSHTHIARLVASPVLPIVCALGLLLSLSLDRVT